MRLAQGRLDLVLARVNPAAGKRHLAGVRAHVLTTDGQ
jgi:hypothetical protein